MSVAPRPSSSAFAILTAALALGMPGCKPAPAPDVLAMAQLSEEGLHPDFIQRWRRAAERVRANRDDAAAWSELARLGLAQGLAEPADLALAEMRRLRPSEARWPYFQALRLAGGGRLAEAEGGFREALRLDPSARPACIKLSDTLGRLGRNSEAADILRVWLADHPQDAHALFGLGRLAFDEGRWDEASDWLGRAQRAEPDFAGAASLLATLAEKAGDPLAAQGFRRQASSLGRYREPEDPWQDELWSDCYDPYRLQVAAAAQRPTSKPGKADEWLERARQLRPEDARTYRQLGRLQLARRNFTEAIAWFEQAVARDPKHAPTYIDWIEALKYLRQREAGERVIEQGLVQCPDAAGLHYEKAVLLISQQRHREAFPFLKRAIELEPERYMAYQTLAAQYFRTNRYEEGLRTLQQGLSHHPRQPALLTMLLRYHIEAGHREEALKTWQAAEAADAAPDALRDLAQLFERRFRERPH